jgi:hypothetical protein
MPDHSIFFHWIYASIFGILFALVVLVFMFVIIAHLTYDLSSSVKRRICIVLLCFLLHSVSQVFVKLNLISVISDLFHYD